MINAVAVRSNEFKNASREFNRGVQIVSPRPKSELEPIQLAELS